MTEWETWALRDPEGAGIDLAEDAVRDSGLTRAELLTEGLDGWYLDPCLDAVRAEILDAAESYLCEVSR
jgi:hypothetical protein